jgi:hypothetical protein
MWTARCNFDHGFDVHQQCLAMRIAAWSQAPQIRPESVLDQFPPLPSRTMQPFVHIPAATNGLLAESCF